VPIWLIITAILVGLLIWRVGIGMLRSITNNAGRTRPEVEDVESP
jgi:hypothetical protein